MAELYGNGDQWPSHQKAYWRTAMGRAQNAGWTFEHVDAPHTFGWLLCPCSQHNVKVDKTARGAEAFAARIPTRIRACEKARGMDSTSVKLVRAEHLLARAEELVSGAESSIGQFWQIQCARDELDRIELQIETADLTLQDAVVQAVIDAEDAAPDPSDVGARVDRAEDHADDAEGVLTTVSRITKAKAYTDRLTELRERIRTIRVQIEAVAATEQK